MHNGVQHAHVHHTRTHKSIADKKLNLDLIHDRLIDLPFKSPLSYFPDNLFRFHMVLLCKKQYNNYWLKADNIEIKW